MAQLRYIIQIGINHSVKSCSLRKGANSEMYLDILAEEGDKEIERLATWKEGDGLESAPKCAKTEDGKNFSHNWLSHSTEKTVVSDERPKENISHG